MKNTIFKSILVLVIAFLALPMMGQDFMNIYFKDGTRKKFYLKNVKEITTSQWDTDGILHSDFEYQHITTIHDKYVYALNDVDSITFSKFYEEQAKENIINTMSTIIPILSNCTTIEEAEKEIQTIKKLTFVDDSWSNGHDLFVKIKEWETMSFVFPHEDVEEGNTDVQGSRLLAPSPHKELVIPNIDERDIYFCIANQFANNVLNADINSDYVSPLIESLEQCKRISVFPTSPTIQFFIKDMYYYDVVFLLTHGSFRKGEGGHTIIASDLLGTSENWIRDPTELEQLDWENKLNAIRSENGDFTDDDICIAWVLERRASGFDELHWYGYPRICESFFDYKNIGHFTNPNSIMFNISCQSMMGDDDTEALSLVEKLKKRGLGIYFGYNEKNSSGHKAGYSLFTSMLNGWSLQRAYDEIPFFYKNCMYELGEFSFLSMKSCNNTVSCDNLFITPIFTTQIDNEEATRTYYNNKTVEIDGFTTSLDPDLISMGFIYGTDQDFNNYSFAGDVDKVKLSIPSNKGNCKLRAIIKDLEPDKTYYYRAFTYDNYCYNYGNICSFKIDKLVDLQIALQSVEMEVGEKVEFDITSGNGTYDIESSDKEVAIASINGEKVKIEALNVGSATITVKDIKTGQTAAIAVTVTGQADGRELMITKNVKGTVYSIYKKTLDDNDYHTNPDGWKCYRSELTLEITKNGTTNSYVVDNNIYLDKEENHHGGQQPCMLLDFNKNMIYIFCNSKDDLPYYSMDGNFYSSSMSNINFTKETVFETANWGWFPYFCDFGDNNINLCNFSYAGYFTIMAVRDTSENWNLYYYDTDISPEEAQAEWEQADKILVIETPQ